jgi:hypothetical protein
MIGVILFVVVFLLAVVLTRTLSSSDLVNIRQIVDGLGPLRKPINIVLGLMEKLTPKSSGSK